MNGGMCVGLLDFTFGCALQMSIRANRNLYVSKVRFEYFMYLDKIEDLFSIAKLLDFIESVPPIKSIILI